MQNNPFLTLIEQDTWNIENLISLLNQIAKRNKGLVFFEEFADLLSQCSTLTAVIRMQDPRQVILNFLMYYRMFTKRESAFYYQAFEPVLNEMISGSPNCVHGISSSNFIKRTVIKTVKSKINLEPPFIQFIKSVRSEIKLKAPVQKPSQK